MKNTAPPSPLATKQRAALRARAHELDPVVIIGSDGLTPSVVKEIDANLKAHELIKVRVLGDDRDARLSYLQTICDELGASAVQHIGKLLVLWRMRPDEPRAVKPADGKRGPKSVILVKPSRSGRRPPTRKKATVLGSQRVTAGGKIKKSKPRQKSIKRSNDA